MAKKPTITSELKPKKPAKAKVKKPEPDVVLETTGDGIIRVKRPNIANQLNTDAIGDLFKNRKAKERHAMAEDKLPIGECSMLDVGCGNGAGTAKFIAHAGRGLCSVVGLDASALACEYARQSGIPTLLGQAEHLPFVDDSFDAVICLDVLHLVDDWEAVMSELKRVTKGRLIISVPNSDRTMWEDRLGPINFSGGSFMWFMGIPEKERRR